MVREFIPVFCEISDKMVEKVGENLELKEFDVLHYTEHCTISMIMASSFNAFPEDLKDSNIEDIVDAMKM